MPTYTIHNVVAVETYPVPGNEVFGTFEADSPLAALDAYSVAEDFAPYSATELRDTVTIWPNGSASAPFTNVEIVAVPARLTLVHPRRFGVATFRQGLHEAVLAATEEHDRDPDEILSPATVELVAVDNGGGGFGPLGYDDEGWNLLVQTKDGRVFRVTAEEETGS